MPLDPILLAETKAWLVKAANDLRGSSINEAVPLTEFAWSYRYPGDPETPTPDEAKTEIATAVRVFDDILKRNPQEAHP